MASADIRFGGGGEAGSTGGTDGKGRVVSGLGGLCLRMRSDTKGVVLTHPQWENRAWACSSAGNLLRNSGACVVACVGVEPFCFVGPPRPSTLPSGGFCPCTLGLLAERNTFGAALQLLRGFLVFPPSCFVVVAAVPVVCVRARAHGPPPKGEKSLPGGGKGTLPVGDPPLAHPFRVKKTTLLWGEKTLPPTKTPKAVKPPTANGEKNNPPPRFAVTIIKQQIHYLKNRNSNHFLGCSDNDQISHVKHGMAIRQQHE